MSIRCIILMVHLFFACALVQAQGSDVNEELAQMFDSSDRFLTVEDRPDRSLEIHLRAGEMLQDPQVTMATRERYHTNMFVLLNRLRRPQQAIPHLRRLLRVMLQRSDGAYSKQYFINHCRMAGAFKQLDQTDSALHYFHQAIGIAETVGDSLYLSSAHNNLGIMYQSLGRADTAMKLYDRAIELLPMETTDDSLFLTSIRDNQASVFKDRKKWQESISILEQNFRFVCNRPDAHQRAMYTGLQLCALYDRLAMVDSMEQMLHRLDDYLVGSQEEWMLEQRIALANQWINYANLIGDHQLSIRALHELDSLRRFQLSRKEAYTIAITEAMANHQISKVERNLKERSELLVQTQKAAQQERLMLVLILVFLVFVSGSALLFYRRKVAMERLQKTLKSAQLENERLEKLALQTDLEHKETDFSNVMMQVALKEDWSKELSNQLEALVKGRTEVPTGEVKQLLREIKQQGGIHDKIELYQQGISEVNAKFFGTLESLHPDLTKTEREICGLIRLNLDGKEIATIRNIHPSSVRKMRQRIRKKLGLQPDQDLYQFVQAI